jgi:hypothetical protein
MNTHATANSPDAPPLAGESPGRRVEFREVFPRMKVAFAMFEEDSRRAAISVLEFMRLHAQQHPDQPAMPVELHDIDAPITRAISYLWGSGLARLWVARDPATGREIGLTTPA